MSSSVMSVYEHETPSYEKDVWSLLFCLCALVTYMYRYTYSGHQCDPPPPTYTHQHMHTHILALEVSRPVGVVLTPVPSSFGTVLSQPTFLVCCDLWLVVVFECVDRSPSILISDLTDTGMFNNQRLHCTQSIIYHSHLHCTCTCKWSL